jgi:HAD superfamily hydrolase (TIGR01484 family)
MFFVALATDYDGTLARDGDVEASVRSAIEELRRSGRKLLLVTGRDLEDLKNAFGPLDVFDMVVAENGALLFDPAGREETALCEPPSPALVDRLRQVGVKPLSVGRTIIATWEPNETIVLEAIRALSLEYNIIFKQRRRHGVAEWDQQGLGPQSRAQAPSPFAAKRCRHWGRRE